MCYQTRQKGNQLSCPHPYVSKVMFHDIHSDSDTCQPQVLALFSSTSIWAPTTSGSWKTEQKKGEKKAKRWQILKEKEKNSQHCLGLFSL